MKRMKQLLLVALLALNVGIVAAPGLASADTAKSDACVAINAGANCSTTSGVTVNGILKATLNILSFVVGATAVVMIIIGGFKYITSGGDSNKVSGAKNTILYAIIGLVIVFMAQFIVQFVLNKVTTTTVTKAPVPATPAPKPVCGPKTFSCPQ